MPRAGVRTTDSDNRQPTCLVAVSLLRPGLVLFQVASPGRGRSHSDSRHGAALLGPAPPVTCQWGESKLKSVSGCSSGGQEAQDQGLPAGWADCQWAAARISGSCRRFEPAARARLGAPARGDTRETDSDDAIRRAPNHRINGAAGTGRPGLNLNLKSESRPRSPSHLKSESRPRTRNHLPRAGLPRLE